MAIASGFPAHRRRVLRAQHHGGRLHALVLGGGAVALVVVCIGDPLEGVVFTPAPTSIVAAADRVETPTAWDARITALETAIAGAVSALEDSDGRVLDEQVRRDLAADVRSGRGGLRELRLSAELAVPGATEVAADTLTADRARVADLADGTALVVAAVASWQAEQERIAAEQEAARRAAEAAAAAAAARAQPRSGVAASAAPAGPYVESIWTTGGQAEIDACRGSVNMADVAGYLGGTFYAAEHWSCGGRSWAGLGTGALVSFPGYGIYQVAGKVGGLPAGSSAAALPPGYDGYYQTCMNGDVGNLHVWLLTRVG